MNAIMSEFDIRRGSEPVPNQWEGFAELDRALAENRLSAYRWRKAWADPIARNFALVVIAVVIGIFAFLAGGSLGYW